jgi:hypothetical protein
MSVNELRCSSGKDPDLYSKGAKFESLPKLWNFLNRLFSVFLRNPRKGQDSTLIKATSVSFHILCNSLLTIIKLLDATIVVWATNNTVNKPQINKEACTKVKYISAH